MERIPRLRLVKLSNADIQNYTTGVEKIRTTPSTPGHQKLLRITHSTVDKSKITKTFECSICSKLFSIKSNLSIHYTMTHDTKRKLCSHCGAGNLRRGTWQGHIMEGPLLKTPKTCSSCSQIFHRQSCYLTHLKIHGIPCHCCGKKFQKPMKLKLHEKKCETGDIGVKCALCDKVFPIQSELEDHTRVHHTKEKPFKCDKCEYRCKTKSEITRHKSINHDPNRSRIFHCDECLKSFYAKALLNKHFKIFHGEKKQEPYTCVICNATFTIVEEFTEHKNKHDVIKCPKCDKVFASYNTIRVHLSTVHTIERIHTCPMGCGSTFQHKHYLKRHIQVHTGEKPLKCEFCEKGFLRRESLKNHLLTHTGEEPFKCIHCEKKYVGRTDYMKHVETHAINRQIYSCPNCEEEYLDKGTWMKHKKEGELESPFTCSDCGNCFHRRACFRNHLRIKRHSVVCEFCKIQFTCLFKFEQHRERHETGRIGPLGSVCPFCNKDFKYYSTLRNHLVVHTKERSYECTYADCKTTFKLKCDLSHHIKTKHSNKIAYDKITFK